MQDNSEQLYFINSLYRDCILSEILGKDASEILYWAGKRVSRRYDLSDIDDLPEFFRIAQFGQLKLISNRRKTVVCELSGQNVTDRIESSITEFTIESGIIAECIARENKTNAEAVANIDAKRKVVEIVVQYD